MSKQIARALTIGRYGTTKFEIQGSVNCGVSGYAMPVAFRPRKEAA